MDCIYGKLNYEKIIKEYSVESNDEYNTIDLKIDNNKNTISAKVNRTPGKLTITKNITPTERETILEFDGSQNKEINLAEIDMYSGLETDTSIVTIDTENNTIKSDVKKTPGTLSFQKADLLLEETFDGSKDVTVKIPETIFHGISRDNTINFETEDFSNIIYAEVNKVPNKLTIIENSEQLNYDGSNEVSVDLTKYAFKDDIPSLQDLPQFTNKLEIDLSYTPSLNGFITFPIVSSSNFYVNWGDGTGTYYQEATTSISHQYSDNEFAGWISIYGDWQGIVFGPDDNDNKLILINIEYDSNITNMPESPLYNCVNLKSIRFSENITLQGYTFYGCENLTSVTLPNSAIIPTNSNGAHFYNCENLTEFEIPKGTIIIPRNFVRHCTNLKSINIPEGVTQIQTYAFMQTGITSVIIPDSVTRLYGSTFLLCNELKHVKIGSGLTQTSDSEFNNCYNIEDVTITALTPPTIQGNIFFNNDTFLLFVKSESLQAYKTATNWTKYADRTYPIGGNYTESITIPSTSWNAETKTVTVTAIGATSEDRNVVMLSIPSEYDDYGIRCIAQSTMTLTFTCDEIPTEDITIGVAYILTNQ